MRGGRRGKRAEGRTEEGDLASSSSMCVVTQAPALRSHYLSRKKKHTEKTLKLTQRKEEKKESVSSLQLLSPPATLGNTTAELEAEPLSLAVAGGAPVESKDEKAPSHTRSVSAVTETETEQPAAAPPSGHVMLSYQVSVMCIYIEREGERERREKAREERE